MGAFCQQDLAQDHAALSSNIPQLTCTAATSPSGFFGAFQLCLIGQLTCRCGLEPCCWQTISWIEGAMMAAQQSSWVQAQDLLALHLLARQRGSSSQARGCFFSCLLRSEPSHQ